MNPSPKINPQGAHSDGDNLHSSNGVPGSRRSISPKFFDEESGSVNNTHTFPVNPNHTGTRTPQHINITLDASPARSPESPRFNSSLTPKLHRSRSDSWEKTTPVSPPRAPMTPPPTHTSPQAAAPNIGFQIQSALARLSTLASESPLISSLKNSSDSTNPPFWKRKGKVPGSVRPVKQENQKPHGFMARPPTPPRDNEEGSHSSPNFTHYTGAAAASPEQDTNRTNGSAHIQPPENNLHKSDATEYEHHCSTFKSCGTKAEQATRLEKFRKILGENVVDLEALKKACWTGIPGNVRAQCWKLLLGYLPANADRRETAIQRKRKEYYDCIPQYYTIPDEERTDTELRILHQIQIDVPRTSPNVPLFQQPVVQELLERVLYIWAIRHPASGYVQGINDLVTPFFVVFLSEVMDNVDTCEASSLPTEKLKEIEADCYWSMSKLLDGIQDHYTFAQPGIQRMTHKLKELVGKIDVGLSRHLGEQDAQYIQFAFRWMNCFLMREMTLPLIVRMWDTYLAEGPTSGFGVFHVYVCAAFLARWSEELRQREFQDIMLFLQHLPTTRWNCKDVEILLSQAFMWMSIFQNAPSHLRS